MRDIVKEVTGVDFMALSDADARAELAKRGLDSEGEKNAAECMYVAFDKLVESTLVQPTFSRDTLSRCRRSPSARTTD